MEEEKNAADRCLEIICEGEYIKNAYYIFTKISTGGCDLEKSYDGPQLPRSEAGKYGIDLDFIKGMIEWFKAGKTLPKRFVLQSTLQWIVFER